MEDNFDFSVLKKKKRKNSRTKGNTFERKVCALLNERFETTDFNRSPGSGAFANTHRLPDHLKVYGDLIVPQKFQYIIECKKGYNKVSLGSLFNIKSEFYDFINQAKRDASKISKKWMVIFQQDRKDTLAIFEDLYLKHTVKDHSFITFNNSNIIVMKLEDLLKVTTKDFWFD